MDSTVYGPMMTENAEFAFVYSKGLLGRPPPAGVTLFPSSDRTAGNPCDARQSEHTLCLAE